MKTENGFELDLDNKTVSTADLVNTAFKLVDPKHGTSFQKSRTAFLSLSMVTGQINISVFFARKVGIMSGDRIGYFTHEKNKFVFLLYKTTQHHKTIEVKIRGGIFSFNSRILVDALANAFELNKDYTKKIRLWINHEEPLKVKIPHPTLGEQESLAFQIIDIPSLREDFATPELKQAYIEKMKLPENIYKIQPTRTNADTR